MPKKTSSSAVAQQLSYGRRKAQPGPFVGVKPRAVAKPALLGQAYFDRMQMQVFVREDVDEGFAVHDLRLRGQGVLQRLAAFERGQAIKPRPYTRRRPLVQPHGAVACLRAQAPQRLRGALQLARL